MDYTRSSKWIQIQPQWRLLQNTNGVSEISQDNLKKRSPDSHCCQRRGKNNVHPGILYFTFSYRTCTDNVKLQLPVLCWCIFIPGSCKEDEEAVQTCLVPKMVHCSTMSKGVSSQKEHLHSNIFLLWIRQLQILQVKAQHLSICSHMDIYQSNMCHFCC